VRPISPREPRIEEIFHDFWRRVGR
jgi:hypothetical protein